MKKGVFAVFLGALVLATNALFIKIFFLSAIRPYVPHPWRLVVQHFWPVWAGIIGGSLLLVILKRVIFKSAPPNTLWVLLYAYFAFSLVCGIGLPYAFAQSFLQKQEVWQDQCAVVAPVTSYEREHGVSSSSLTLALRCSSGRTAMERAPDSDIVKAIFKDNKTNLYCVGYADNPFIAQCVLW